MFKGICCYPLSPPLSPSSAPSKSDKDSTNFIDKNDLLLKICNKLPISENQDQNLSFICGEDEKEYVENTLKICSKAGKKKTLFQKFGHTSPELLNILESMLQFNPFFRPTAKELLKHPIFDKIRLPEIEK